MTAIVGSGSTAFAGADIDSAINTVTKKVFEFFIVNGLTLATVYLGIAQPCPWLGEMLSVNDLTMPPKQTRGYQCANQGIVRRAWHYSVKDIYRCLIK